MNIGNDDLPQIRQKREKLKKYKKVVDKPILICYIITR